MIISCLYGEPVPRNSMTCYKTWSVPRARSTIYIHQIHSGNVIDRWERHMDMGEVPSRNLTSWHRIYSYLFKPLPILDTLQKNDKFFAGERRYSHWYQKTKGLKYPCKIDLEYLLPTVGVNPSFQHKSNHCWLKSKFRWLHICDIWYIHLVLVIFQSSRRSIDRTWPTSTDSFTC